VGYEFRVRRVGQKENTRRLHLDDIEELCDDGSYSSEEGGAGLALHLVTVSLDFDEGALLLLHVLHDAGGIHFVHGWNEDGGRVPGLAGAGAVDGGEGRLGFQELEVGWECTGIGCEVFVWGELGRIDEDGDDGEVVFGEGLADWKMLVFWGIGEDCNAPSERCPSCRAPIVGTKPTDWPFLKAFCLHSL